MIKNRGKLIIIKHAIVGVIIFYIFIHPLTMFIYWFEFSDVKLSDSQFLEILLMRLKESFSFNMVGMSLIFVFLGGLLGICSGVYYKNIVQKKKVLKLQQEQLERNIEFIINSGENESMEFKSSLRYDYVNDRVNKILEKAFLKTVAGFLNARGGTLLLGINDNGTTLGLENDYVSLKKKNKDGFELKLMQLISTSIGTEFCSLIHISFYNRDEKEVCSVEINPSSVPAYVYMEGNTIFYLRTGNSTKKLTVKETVDYIKFKKRI